MNLRRGVPWLVAGVIATACLSLAGWQLGRARYKDALALAAQQAGARAPVPLSTALAAGALPERVDRRATGEMLAPEAMALPLRVRGTGSFDPCCTLLLDNQVRDRRLGAMVYTLFRPEGPGPAVLVNRGWVPMSGTRRIAPLPAAPAGTIDLSGTLTAAPRTGVRMGEARVRPGNDPELLPYLDLDTISQDLRTDLFRGVVLLDATLPGGFERAWTEAADPMTPDRHRGYALQWLGLALAVLACAYVWQRRSAA